MTKFTLQALFFILSLNSLAQCPTASFSTNDTVSCTYPFELICTDLSTNTDTWSWDFGDGSATSSLQNPTHTFTVEGNFNVELTATNTTSGCVETHLIEIIVDSVEIDIISPEGFGRCFSWIYDYGDESFNFYDNTNEGINWIWDFGDNVTSTTSTNQVNHAYNDTGHFDVSVIKINPSGCSASDTLISSIQILATPTAGFSLTQISNGCSLPDSLLFQDTTNYFGYNSPPQTYAYLSGSNGSSNYTTSSTDTMIFGAYGNWNIYSVVYNIIGCADTTIVSINISPAHEQFDTLNICYNSSYTFNNNILIDSIIADTSYSTTYSSQGCDSLVHTYLRVAPEINTNDTVSICYNSSYLFNNNVLIDSIVTDTTFLIIHAGQNCDSLVYTHISVKPEINTVVTQNGMELFANSNSALYQWVDCNNSFTELLGDTNQTFIPQSNGDYALVINENGCMDTSACYLIEGVGIVDKSTLLNFDIYPNPSQGEFQVNYQTINEPFTIEVIDFSGRVLYTQLSEVNTTSLKFNLSLTNGIYFVKLTTRSGHSKTKKITIK